MGTSECWPLELIYGEFRRALESGDTECALDLMATAALAAQSTPAQIEREKLWDLARCGAISVECADIRRNQDFENAALRFAVSAVSPLSSALPADVGASMVRRQGWIYAWDQLRNCHPASNSESLVLYSRAVSDYLGGEATPGLGPGGDFAHLTRVVEQQFSDYSRGCLTRSVPVSVADEEDGPENETRIIDEFESFLGNGEPAQGLNLLAVAWFGAGSYGLEDETISQLVARSANLIRDNWDDSTEIKDVLSRLWVTAYSELVQDAQALGELPGFEAELPPLSAADQQFLSSSLEEYEARQFGQYDGDDEEDLTNDPDEDVPDDPDEDDFDSLDEPGYLEDEDDLASLVPRSPLVATALRHLEQTIGFHPGSSVLSEASVDAAHQIWVTHATITASWDDNGPEAPGYGRKIRAEIEKWAEDVAAQMYPHPADSRPTPQKRGRRIYESTWAWAIAAGIFAVIVRAYGGFWFAVGLGALIGHLFSSNYDSISAPRLEPLPDPAADDRAKVRKALLEIGMHVAVKYDSAEYASDLSPAALRQLVNGAWQPQGPPPPRMRSCTHREAEYVAAQWMRYLGATSCRVTQASRDGGMDIVSDTHVAEVKHHQSPVGVSFVRQIYGTATSTSKMAVFFSLSEYTREAKEFANANNIALFRYDPLKATLAPKSQSALEASQHGLNGGRKFNGANT